jgi:hypothetical protein
MLVEARHDPDELMHQDLVPGEPGLGQMSSHLRPAWNHARSRR